MTEEILDKGKSLLAKKQHADLYKKNITKMNTIDNKDIYNVYLACRNLNLDVPIPEELMKTISDLLYYYYSKMSDELKKEFELLGTQKINIQRNARWENHGKGWLCNNCNHDQDDCTKYCSNCGCLMEG